MGSKKYQRIFVISAFAFFSFLFLNISQVWSVGYQEEKLFEGDFYSTEDMEKKLEAHEAEIKTLDNEIRFLKKEIDWMVLKINKIQDSGRSAPVALKQSITRKEKKIQTLEKTKNRLEYLVKFYSQMQNNIRQEEIEEIYNKKIPELKRKQQMAEAKTEAVQSAPISQGPPASVTTTLMQPQGDLDLYDGVSKTELQTAVEKAGLSDWVEIVGTGSCLRLETTLPILFPTGSAKVSDEYKSFFKKLSDFLKPYDVKILVNGYADTVPISNKVYPSNFELGASRAANIVHQMVGYGLKPSIFRVESTGKYRFSAKGMSGQKALERRAEVTVIFSG